jgi:hypothetical protein
MEEDNRGFLGTFKVGGWGSSKLERVVKKEGLKN